MKIEECVNIAEALAILDTYDSLFRKMATQHGVRIVKKGNGSFVERKEVERLRPHIEAWKNRPRMFKKMPVPA